MAYFTTYKKYNIRLTKTEEIALMERYHHGDNSAKTILIESILPWIVKIAKKFKNCGLEFDDIVQMGNLGAVQSLAGFDPARGRLSTYITAAAIFEIQRGINRDGIIRVPRTAFLSTNPKTREYAQRAKGVQGIQSIDIAERENTTEEPISLRDLKKLRNAIQSLNERHAMLIRWRLQGKSLEEIGDELNVCKERARQLEMKALASLQIAMGQQDRPQLISVKSIIRGAIKKDIRPRTRDNDEVVRYSRRGIKIGKN